MFTTTSSAWRVFFFYSLLINKTINKVWTSETCWRIHIRLLNCLLSLIRFSTLHYSDYYSLLLRCSEVFHSRRPPLADQISDLASASFSSCPSWCHPAHWSRWSGLRFMTCSRTLPHVDGQKEAIRRQLSDQLTTDSSCSPTQRSTGLFHHSAADFWTTAGPKLRKTKC